jgi:hypothetical protein
MKGGVSCSIGTVKMEILTTSANTVSSPPRPRKLVSTPAASEHRLTKWVANNALVGSALLMLDASYFSSPSAGMEGFAS